MLNIDSKNILCGLFLGMILCLFWCWMTKKSEGFTLSQKPFEEDNSLFLRNPFDDIDYRTPVFDFVPGYGKKK